MHQSLRLQRQKENSSGEKDADFLRLNCVSDSQNGGSKFNLRSTVIKGLGEFPLRNSLGNGLNEHENPLPLKGVLNLHLTVWLVLHVNFAVL